MGTAVVDLQECALGDRGAEAVAAVLRSAALLDRADVEKRRKTASEKMQHWNTIQRRRREAGLPRDTIFHGRAERVHAATGRLHHQHQLRRVCVPRDGCACATALAEGAARIDVLICGGAGGGALREVLRCRAVQSATVVDIVSDLVELLGKERHKRHNDDHDVLLRTAERVRARRTYRYRLETKRRIHARLRKGTLCVGGLGGCPPPFLMMHDDDDDGIISR